MKLDDAVLGALFALLGGTIVLVASGYHALRHISYGPSFFPTLIGAGLIACGVLLIARRLAAGGLKGGGWLVPGPWFHSMRGAAGFILIPLSVLAYILVVERVGFFITMAVLLAVQIGWFTGRWRRAAGIALLVTFAIQEFFQGFMSVPLPWGVLEPLAGALTWM